MQFRNVFIAVLLSGTMLVAAFLLSSRRPAVEVDQPNADAVRATGKCAQCHQQETGAIVHEFEMSAHFEKGVSCLGCHRPAPGQEATKHHGFELSAKLTAANCRACHSTQYAQFARSRHAAPSWAAVHGRSGFTEKQLAEAMAHHPEAVDRAANGLARLEGESAIVSGCESCHGIGRPNPDGSFGTCTECHSRHNASLELARTPTTCGQCHMGPDHSQLEIYNESKHGALFATQRGSLRMDAPATRLTTRDMPVPTCATCHMSGLEGAAFTHDVTERLSWYLFAPISKKRPGYAQAQTRMKEICTNCHTQKSIDAFYDQAEAVVASTNARVADMQALMKELRASGKLSPEPFDESIEFLEFDYWHYFGRTAKHGAFMGGGDFVQWHGNYELLKLRTEMEELAEQLGGAHRDAGLSPEPER